MNDGLIKCPKCLYQFAATESIKSEVKAELEEQYSQRLRDENAKHIGELAKLESQLRTRLVSEAREETLTAMGELQARFEEERDKVRAAQGREVELRKAQRELEAAKEELEVRALRRLDQERAKVKEEALARAAEEHALRQGDWEKQRSDMARQIDDLKRRAEQGSQQAQGEAAELELEATLRELFPRDEVVPVAKGVRGGDVLQKVQTQGGVYAGSVLWELKRTKAWSDGWVPKLKDDQREAKADIAVIVTAALPAGVKAVGLVDGVWVADFRAYAGVAAILRSWMFEVSKAKSAASGRVGKVDALYNYVTGNEFRGRVETVVEAFVEMQDDLATERRAIERAWAKREKQIGRAVIGLSGMYGDMQGQTGALPDISRLSLELGHSSQVLLDKMEPTIS